MTILLHFHYTSFTSRHYPAQFNFETMFISKLENKDAKIGKWSKYLWSIYILMKMFHVSVQSYLLSSFLFIVTFFKLSWRKCQIPISKKIRVLSDDDLFDCLDSNAIFSTRFKCCSMILMIPMLHLSTRFLSCSMIVWTSTLYFLGFYVILPTRFQCCSKIL